MRNPRFTKYNDYPYDYIVKKAVDKGMITKGDQDLIINYIVDKLSKGEIEAARAQRISTYLTQWRRYIAVPYNRMTYNELLKGVAAIRKGTTAYGTPYSPDTVRGCIKAIKTFTKYLAKKGVVKISREDLEEIKYPKEITDSIKSQDLLSDEKTEKLIGAVRKLRDKAIIGTLKDTGLRPVDLTGMKWRDLDYNQRRIKITVIAEKTNMNITCYVILHKSWLVELRKQYNNASDDDYVFLDDKGRPMSWVAIDRMLKRAGEKAGVKFPKGATAKLFRATSITDKEKAGFTRASVSRLHFGVDDSKQINHYSKYNDEDVERESLELLGVMPPEPLDVMRPTLCPQCNELISPGMKFCPECTCPLTPQAVSSNKDMARMFREMLRDPELKKEILAELQSV